MPVYTVQKKETLREQLQIINRMITLNEKLYHGRRNGQSAELILMISAAAMLLFSVWIRNGFFSLIVLGLYTFFSDHAKKHLQNFGNGYYSRKSREEKSCFQFYEDGFCWESKREENFWPYAAIDRIWEDEKVIYLFFGKASGVYVWKDGIAGPGGETGFRRFLKEKWSGGKEETPEMGQKELQPDFIIEEVWDEDRMAGVCEFLFWKNQLVLMIMATVIIGVFFLVDCLLSWEIPGWKEVLKILLWAYVLIAGRAAVYAIPGFRPGIRRRMARNMRERSDQNLIGQEICYYVDQEGISWDMPVGKGNYPYGKIALVKKWENGFVVKMKDKSVVYLRKSHFIKGSPETFQSFLNKKLSESKEE